MLDTVEVEHLCIEGNRCLHASAADSGNYCPRSSPRRRSFSTANACEYQWRQAFQSADGSWFCFVIEESSGELIGFAKGQRYAHPDQPDFAGELNKIYLLREYHRRGLGRRLLGHVARRFLSQGISTMLLFGDARNPSNGFYETFGADKLFAANGEFHGGYGWRDLRKLASICPTD